MRKFSDKQSKSIKKFENFSNQSLFEETTHIENVTKLLYYINNNYNNFYPISLNEESNSSPHNGL